RPPVRDRAGRPPVTEARRDRRREVPRDITTALEDESRGGTQQRVRRDDGRGPSPGEGSSRRSSEHEGTRVNVPPDQGRSRPGSAAPREDREGVEEGRGKAPTYDLTLVDAKSEHVRVALLPLQQRKEISRLGDRSKLVAQSVARRRVTH